MITETFKVTRNHALTTNQYANRRCNPPYRSGTSQSRSARAPRLVILRFSHHRERSAVIRFRACDFPVVAQMKIVGPACAAASGIDINVTPLHTKSRLVGVHI
jgi:hypothetical protein